MLLSGAQLPRQFCRHKHCQQQVPIHHSRGDLAATATAVSRLIELSATCV